MASLKVEIPATGTPVTLQNVKDFLRINTTDDDAILEIMLDAATESAESFCNRSFCNKGYLQGLDSFPYFTDAATNQGQAPPSYNALPRYSTTLWNYSQMIKLYRPPLVTLDRITFLSSADSQWHDMIPFPGVWYPGQAVTVGMQRMDNNANIQQCTVAGTTGHNPPTWATVITNTTAEPSPSTVVWQNMGPFNGQAFPPTPVQGQFGNYIVDPDSAPARVFPGPPGALWPPVLYVPNSVQLHFTAGYSVDGTKVPPRAKMAIMQTCAHWYENREPIIPGQFTELPMHCQMLLWSLRVFDVAPTRG